MLEVRGLRKAYGPVTALAGLDLQVARGEVTGLIGHNGAGKSTLVGAIAGLLLPDAGQVLVDGIDAARDPRAVRRRLGVAPQEEALYPAITVREHLRLFATLGGLRGASARRAIERTAEEMALTGVLDRRVGVLSGGQRRRTQTASALVHSPPLLVLDEPTVGADPDTRRALLAAVRGRADAGAAVLYTTHYLPELEDLDATLAVMVAGRLVGRGARRELMSGLPGLLRLAFREPIGPAAVQVLRAVAGDGGGVSVELDEREARIAVSEPGRLLADLLAKEPELARSLAEVEVEGPSLDDLAASLGGGLPNVA
jgi:ABC-2 type transport system ATP-binding protein